MARSFGSQLARDTVTYGVAGGAHQLVAIILVPIYARVLGASGVGVAGVFQSTISLSAIVIGLAWPQAFLRWYLREHRHAPDEVVAVTMIIRLAASVVGLAIVVVGMIPLTRLLYNGDYLSVFALVGPIVVIDSLNAVPLTFFRAERRPRPYLVIAIARSILGGVLIVGLVVGLGLGVLGVALGTLLAAAIAAAVGMALLFRSTTVRLSLNRPLAASMLRFAAPLMAAAGGLWILNLSDRPLLQALTGSSEIVGVYTVGYTAGLVISALVVQPFSLAWGAAHWELKENAPRQYARVMTSFLAVAVGVAVLLSGLGTDAIRLLFGPEFEESRYIVPFSAFGFVLYGVHVIAWTGLSVTGRASLTPVSLAAAVLVSIVLNIALIPHLGMYGAALATISGYFVLAVASGILSHRHYPVPWELGRAVAIVGLGVTLSAAAILGPDNPAWRLATVLVYAPVVLQFIARTGRL